MFKTPFTTDSFVKGIYDNEKHGWWQGLTEVYIRQMYKKSRFT